MFFNVGTFKGKTEAVNISSLSGTGTKHLTCSGLIELDKDSKAHR
jgi:hypothetical protein